MHRIGRTGRCGKTGIATSFINKDQSESILLDLKHLLTEAKQRIPPVLTVRALPTRPVPPQLPCRSCGLLLRLPIAAHAVLRHCRRLACAPTLLWATQRAWVLHPAT